MQSNKFVVNFFASNILMGMQPWALNVSFLRMYSTKNSESIDSRFCSRNEFKVAAVSKNFKPGKQFWQNHVKQIDSYGSPGGLTLKWLVFPKAVNLIPGCFVWFLKVLENRKEYLFEGDGNYFSFMKLAWIVRDCAFQDRRITSSMKVARFVGIFIFKDKFIVNIATDC